MKIVLFGFPGTGTSSVGRCLASDLGCPFVDVDELFAAEQGDRRRHFALVEGEESVRRLEREAVARALRSGDCVIAAGAAEVPRETLLSAGDVEAVLLTAEPAMVLARTAASLEERISSLKSRDAIETVRVLMRERERRFPPCRLRLDTTSLTPEESARRIRDALRHPPAG